VQRHKCARNREMQIQIVGETEGCRKKEKQKMEKSGQICEDTRGAEIVKQRYGE
jgi:hypothetical protein